ncbi:hypothetical protein PAHAL_1G240600 [Panicum hallii]|uniref:Uncharacterized protein n=1 Tax=Panicum hallii TaxID=206008 RepID=A0A2T8KWB2_9POAL|nr:hypothetical protein PAHAL_1G240600 [Panicum hallii]
MIETITQNRIHPGQKQTNTKVAGWISREIISDDLPASLYSLQATKPQNICLIATAGSPRLWPPSGVAAALARSPGGSSAHRNNPTQRGTESLQLDDLIGIYLFTGCWSSHRPSSHATSSYFFYFFVLLSVQLTSS